MQIGTDVRYDGVDVGEELINYQFKNSQHNIPRQLKMYVQLCKLFKLFG